MLQRIAEILKKWGDKDRKRSRMVRAKQTADSHDDLQRSLGSRFRRYTLQNHSVENSVFCMKLAHRHLGPVIYSIWVFRGKSFFTLTQWCGTDIKKYFDSDISTLALTFQNDIYQNLEWSLWRVSALFIQQWMIITNITDSNLTEQSLRAGSGGHRALLLSDTSFLSCAALPSLLRALPLRWKKAIAPTFTAADASLYSASSPPPASNCRSQREDICYNHPSIFCCRERWGGVEGQHAVTTPPRCFNM